MGKNTVKKYILISGFNITSPNRGTAALGYGAVSFLKEKEILGEDTELLVIHVLGDGSDKFRYGYIERALLTIQGNDYVVNIAHISYAEYLLVAKLGVIWPLGILKKVMRNTKCVAAINGGDGFSDIYGTMKYRNCIMGCQFSILYDVPLIILPQTIGPFSDANNLDWANKILKHAQKIYVRDDKYIKELKMLGVSYEITKDLSYYMKPEPFPIDIKPNAIGLNVSGLAYSNQFGRLAGQFSSYPALIDSIIHHFQEKGLPIYLIPHSYNYGNPDVGDDDFEACQEVYNKLSDRSNVYFVDKDLISPQVKYVISKMSFFIGMRMHSNFAAIYTNTPVFGLAYSYKFAGAFSANGLSEAQTYLINNLPEEKIDDVIDHIDIIYNKLVQS